MRRRLVPAALTAAQRIAEAYDRGYCEGLRAGRVVRKADICRRLGVMADREAARAEHRAESVAPRGSQEIQP